MRIGVDTVRNSKKNLHLLLIIFIRRVKNYQMPRVGLDSHRLMLIRTLVPRCLSSLILFLDRNIHTALFDAFAFVVSVGVSIGCHLSF